MKVLNLTTLSRLTLHKATLCLVAGVFLFASCKQRGEESALKDDESEAFDPEFRSIGSYPIWSYDGGPSPTTDHGKELIDLNARIPFFPGLSKAIYGDQMFRPAFGPIPWRMRMEKNKIQILFIGQDGTHIAEAAGRPATAGFGGRAQDLAAYFGVSSGAAFINTYAFTIRWQYGAFDTPMISSRNGRDEFSFASYTGNPVWLITQDQDSPVVKWRNDLIEWIIRNNADSLKMIVLFGGAARDAAGSFIESRGKADGDNYYAAVTPRYPANKIKDLKIRIPEFGLTGAGSNKQTAYPMTTEGRDMLLEFARLKGLTVRYTDPASVTRIHDAFAKAYNNQDGESAEVKALFAKLALPQGGLHGSGMLHPAQLGGYDIGRGIRIVNRDMSYDSDWGTLSLKGLKLSNGQAIKHDVLVTQLPHPTALSMMSKEEASSAVARGLTGFKKYVDAGWKIEAETEAGFENEFAAGKPFRYGRGDMGPEYYDFGAPNSRMVNVSSASRSGFDTIIFGTRDAPRFDNAKLAAMKSGRPSSYPPNDEMWIARSNSTQNSRRTTFDPGPGREMAKLMKTSLPRDAAFIKKYEVNGDFGHYRGTFKDPQVVILADPEGDDDLITSRALTGSRGQYLHSVMESIGVGDKYLVFKTAPFSNYSTNDPESSHSRNWREILQKTENYRNVMYKKIFEVTTPKLIIVDGPDAANEYKRIFPSCPVSTQGECPVVFVTRQADKKDAGISEAVEKIRSVAGFNGASFSGKMTDIPRSHMPYYARVWEGTSGDRVITSNDPSYLGKAFAEVAPKWAYNQPFRMTSSDVDGCVKMVSKQAEAKTRLGGEKVTSYYTRIRNNTPVNAQSICGGGSGAQSGPSEGAVAGGDAQSEACAKARLLVDLGNGKVESHTFPALADIDPQFFESKEEYNAFIANLKARMKEAIERDCGGTP